MVSKSRWYQSGLSLVEASVALVICGVVVVILWQFAAGQVQQQSRQKSGAELDRARAAVVAYAFLHARLPCPAATTDGLQSCAGSQEGYLPYITLGLPQPEAGKIRYSVSPLSPSLTNVDGFGFRALMNPVPPTATTDPVAVLVPLKSLSTQTDRMLDFCAALAASGAAETEAFSVSTKGDGYAKAIFKSGHATSRLELMARLHCTSLIASAGRAHFNTQLAAASMSKAIQDYRTQFEVAYGLAHFDVAQGIWFMANSIYSSWRKWAKLSEAQAAVHANLLRPELLPIKQAAVVKAIQAQVMQGVYAVAMTSNVARFSNNLANTDKTRAQNDLLVDNIIRLDKEITRNAVLNSTSAFFLNEQKLGPLGDVALGDGPAYQLSGPAAEMVSLTANYAKTLGVPIPTAKVGSADDAASSDADARKFVDGLRECTSQAECDAHIATYADQTRKSIDAVRGEPPAGPDPADVAPGVVPAPMDKDMKTAYDALRNCAGDAACAKASSSLETLVQERAAAQSGSQAGSSPDTSASERISREMERITADLRSCSQAGTCDEASLQRQIDRLVK